VDLAQLVAQVAQVVLAQRVRVAQVVLVQVSVAATRAPASVVQVQALVQVHQPVVASRAHAQVPAVAVAAVAQQVHSVRVALAVPRRLASRSVRNAKSSNKEWLRASVAQLCLVATAPPSFAYVVEQASRTSPTRLMPTPVS
jgi:hypothetical protein